MPVELARHLYGSQKRLVFRSALGWLLVEEWGLNEESGMGFGSMTYDGGLQAVRSQGRHDAQIAFEVVADDDGTPTQTVAREARDETDGRKSQRTRRR